jgi:hypothetical protein
LQLKFFEIEYSFETFKKFIEEGVFINSLTTMNNDTLLSHSVINCSFEYVKVLIDNGALIKVIKLII